MGTYLSLYFFLFFFFFYYFLTMTNSNKEQKLAILDGIIYLLVGLIVGGLLFAAYEVYGTYSTDKTDQILMNSGEGMNSISDMPSPIINYYPEDDFIKSCFSYTKHFRSLLADGNH